MSTPYQPLLRVGKPEVASDEHRLLPELIKELEDDLLSGTTLYYLESPSARSSEVSLRSPSLGATSTASSPIFVGLGISPSTADSLTPRKADFPGVPQYQLPPALSMAQDPVQPRRGDFTHPRDPAEWANKPLPLVPSDASTPRGAAINSLPPPYTHLQARKRKHYTLPRMPQPRHLAALDRAFVRGGMCRPHAPQQDDQRHPGGHMKWSTAGERNCQKETANKTSKIDRRRAANARLQNSNSLGPGPMPQPCPTHDKPSLPLGLLGRVFQRLRLASSPYKGRPRSVLTPPFQHTYAPRPADRLPTPLLRLSPTQQAEACEPRPTRRPGRTVSPMDRIKRVLSALMEERMLLHLASFAEPNREQYLQQLLHQAQLLLLDGLQSPPHGQETGERRSDPPHDGRPVAHRGRPVPIMLRVLEEIDSLKDLFSFARVNRASYLTFKAHELSLIKATLWKSSPPAWELRQVSEAPWDAQQLAGCQSLAASLYLRHYAQDLFTLAQIRILLHAHCRLILREETAAALVDPYNPQSADVDVALWRVWTFCQLFGSRKDRERDFAGQARWLRGGTIGTDLPSVCRTSPGPSDFKTVLFTPPEGFAHGNQGPLSKDQLWDMVEVWTALDSLLDGLREATDKARRYGIFDRAQITPGDPQQERSILGAWLDFIMTLGPTAVLALAPLGPNSDPDQAFVLASVRGWTHWTPPTLEDPPANFLTGVIKTLIYKGEVTEV